MASFRFVQCGLLFLIGLAAIIGGTVSYVVCTTSAACQHGTSPTDLFSLLIVLVFVGVFMIFIAVMLFCSTNVPEEYAVYPVNGVHYPRKSRRKERPETWLRCCCKCTCCCLELISCVEHYDCMQSSACNWGIGAVGQDDWCYAC